MRIALFSLLSDTACSSSALWSHLFLKNRPQGVHVDVFLDDLELRKLKDKTGSKYPGVSFHHYLRAFLQHRLQEYDVFVYHIENNERCDFIRRSLSLRPGIKCFHDIHLPRLKLAPFAHSTGGSDVDKCLQAEIGEDFLKLGDYFVRDWSIDSFLERHNFSKGELKTVGVNVVFSQTQKDWLRVHLGVSSQLWPFVSLEFSENSEPACDKPNGRNAHVSFAVLGLNPYRIERYVSAFLHVQENGGIDFCCIAGSEAEQSAVMAILHRFRRDSPYRFDVFISEQIEEVSQFLLQSDLYISLQNDLRKSPLCVTRLAMAKGLRCLLPVFEYEEFDAPKHAVTYRPGIGEILEVCEMLKVMFGDKQRVKSFDGNALLQAQDEHEQGSSGQKLLSQDTESAVEEVLKGMIQAKSELQSVSNLHEENLQVQKAELIFPMIRGLVESRSHEERMSLALRLEGFLESSTNNLFASLPQRARDGE